MIKQTGITRKTDGLGRIVIPIELRRDLCWDETTPIEIARMGRYVLLCERGGACDKLPRTNAKNPLMGELTNLLGALSDEDFLLVRSMVLRLHTPTGIP